MENGKFVNTLFMDCHNFSYNQDCPASTERDILTAGEICKNNCVPIMFSYYLYYVAHATKHRLYDLKATTDKLQLL